MIAPSPSYYGEYYEPGDEELDNQLMDFNIIFHHGDTKLEETK
jgi:hypothetical protein